MKSELDKAIKEGVKEFEYMGKSAPYSLETYIKFAVSRMLWEQFLPLTKRVKDETNQIALVDTLTKLTK